MSESINKKLKEQESTDVNMDFSPAWIGGLSVVFVGAIFLLQNMGVIGSSGNWWAWFILISVFVSFSMAWRAYVHNGRQLTRFPRMMISSGVLTLCVALIFLAGMSWSVVWPGFLMVVGLGILFVNTAQPIDSMVYIHTALGLGALVSGLGIVLMPKGSAKHKNVGRLYVVTMYLLCLTSFSLQRVFGSLGFFHVFSILSIVNITIGLLPLLFKKRWPLWYVYHHTLMLYSFVGLIMALNSHFAQYIEMNEILERVLLWGTPYLVGSVFIIRRHIYLVNRLSSKKIVG